VPRIGPTEGTSTTWPSRPITDRPATRPSIAVVIGIAIATAVPKVNSRTITAIETPITSLDSVEGLDTACPR